MLTYRVRSMSISLPSMAISAVLAEAESGRSDTAMEAARILRVRDVLQCVQSANDRLFRAARASLGIALLIFSPIHTLTSLSLFFVQRSFVPLIRLFWTGAQLSRPQ